MTCKVQLSSSKLFIKEDIQPHTKTTDPIIKYTLCRNNWLLKGGLNRAWTQFAINRNHQPRQKYISTDKAVLYWFTLISWATSRSPLNKPFKRFHYSVNSYNEYTNLSRLQRVHKPLQVITSTQTSPSYHEYTNLSRLQRVDKPLQVVTSTQTFPGYTSLNRPLRSRPRIKETLLKERIIKAHKGLLHNGEELHNSFTQPKLYMLSIANWQ